jgi:protein TonB
MDAETSLEAASHRGMRAHPTGGSDVRVPTVLAIAALHMALLAALGLASHARHSPMPPAEISIPIVFVPAAPAPAAPAPPILAASTLPIPTEMQAAALAPLPRLTLPPSRTGEAPRAVPPRPHRMTATPMPRAPETQAPRPDAPPAAAPAAPIRPPHDSLPALARWEARIRQAVQDAAIYPASARLLHRDGSAQISFEYNRGAVEHASIIQTSHVGSLDNAALAAVTRAAIPDPPAELGPQKRTMLVWVQFRLMATE